MLTRLTPLPGRSASGRSIFVGVDFDGDFSIVDALGAIKPIRRDETSGRKRRRCASAYVGGWKGMGITINAGSQLGSYGIDIAVGVE